MLIYFLFKTLKSTNCTNSSKSYTDHIRPDFPTRRFSSVQRDDITPQVRNCATCGFLKSKGKRSPSCATYGPVKMSAEWQTFPFLLESRLPMGLFLSIHVYAHYLAHPRNLIQNTSIFNLCLTHHLHA